MKDYITYGVSNELNQHGRTVPRLSLLDILRTLALLQVSVFHQHVRLLPSGYLAVLTFFILSAYLLFRGYVWRRYDKYTNLRLQYPTSSISFGACNESLKQRLLRLIRQMTKLYLPFVIMIVIISLMLCCFYPEYLAKQAGILRASLLGGNNYQQLVEGQSYFRGAGFLAPFTHIWALSVEWQYYFVLFLLLIPLYQRVKKRYFRRLCLLLAIISQLLLWIIAFVPALQERAYFASFCRSLPFFAGILIADLLTVAEYKFNHLLFLYHTYDDKRLLARALNFCRLSSSAAKILATSSFIVLFLLPFLELNLQKFYFWQNLIYTILLVLFIYASVNLEMWAQIQSTHKNFTWRRKYGQNLTKLTVYAYHFYLWHFPIQAFITKVCANLTWSVWIFDFLSITISAIISYASYLLTKYLEHNLKANMIRVLCLTLTIILLLVPYANLGRSKQNELDAIADKINSYEQKSAGTDKSQSPEVASNKISEKKKDQNFLDEDANASSKDSLPLTDNVLDDTDRQHLAQFEEKMLNIMQNYPELKFKLRDFENLRLRHYTLLGDSIGIFLSYFVSYYLPNAQLDVHSLRKMSEAKNVYEQAKKDGKIGDAIIALFGTNGIVKVEEIEELYKLTEQDKKPLFLTTVVLPWTDQETENNNLIRQFVKEHKNCYLIDWYRYAKNNASYFEADNIHPSAAGCELYMHLICKSLVEALSK